MEAEHPCALCAAMIASGFPSTCPPEQAKFSRDPRVCDACLSTDFESAPKLGRFLLRGTFVLVWAPAWFPSVYVLHELGLRGWPLLLGTAGLAALAALLVMGLISLWLRIADLSYARRRPNEARGEAERFYCLALWAALTGRFRFSRTMLAKAQQMGFADSVRLNDPTFLQTA